MLAMGASERIEEHVQGREADKRPGPIQTDAVQVTQANDHSNRPLHPADPWRSKPSEAVRWERFFYPFQGVVTSGSCG